jgi:ribosomal protein L29
MKIKELRMKSEKELTLLLASSREKLRDLKFKAANKQLKDVREIRDVKKLIAQVLTLLNTAKRSHKNQ